MKYLATIFISIVLIGFAYFQGYSVAVSNGNEVASPCTPLSILSAQNPDARYSHCRDKDWDGSTLFRDRLAESEEKPEQYAIFCENRDSRRMTAIPYKMTTDDDRPSGVQSQGTANHK